MARQSRDVRTETLVRGVLERFPLDVLILYRNAEGWAMVYSLEDVDDALFELRTAAIRLREMGAARRREAPKPATRSRPKPAS